MNQKLEIVKNLLAELLNYLFFWALGTVILTDFAGIRINQAWLWAPALLAFFYYALRERCRRFWVFFLLHILPIGAFWMVYQGNIFQKIWMVAVMVILAMISFGKRMHGAEMGMNVIMPIIFAGLLWVLYFVDKTQGGDLCGGILLYTLIGFIVGYLGHYFLGQFIHYIDMNNRTTENIPVGHVFRSSAGLAGGFTVLAGIVMVLGSNRELLERIGAAIHQAIINILIFLVSLLPKGAEVEEEVEAVMPQGGQAPMPWEEMEAAEPSVLLKILETLIGLAVMVGIVVFLFMAVIKLIKWIRDIFAQRRTSSAVMDEVHEDLVEKLERQEGKGKEKKSGTIWERAQKALSPEERLRRIYKKTIEKGLVSADDKRKEGLTSAKTPREWCARLFPEREQEALEFAVLYEKARYSARLCSADDVKRARKLAEEFHR